jgi:hypothetical protein
MEGIGMTTALATSTTPHPGHIWRVVRLHFVNVRATIVIPWLVLGIIFVMNLLIWGLILANLSGKSRVDASAGFQYSGSSFYIYVYMLIVAIQAVSITFPFALGYGVTRRHFYLGTSVAFALLAVGYAAAFTLLSYIEQWTNGWGLGGHMFTAVYYGDGVWYGRFFVFLVGLLFFFFVGAAAATVWVRWKALGLVGYFAVIVLVAIGLLELISVTSSWAAVGRWLDDAGRYGVVAALLVPTAISAIAGFFILRRATPKS